jgi:hypothetical protein
VAEKKPVKKSKSSSKTSKVPPIKDLSPRKNPKGGDRPHSYGGGGGGGDE